LGKEFHRQGAKSAKKLADVKDALVFLTKAAWTARATFN
jgi:hypothetical protein